MADASADLGVEGDDSEMISLRAVWSFTGECIGDFSLPRASSVERLYREVAAFLQDVGMLIITWQGEELLRTQTLAEIEIVEDAAVQVVRGSHPIFGKWKVIKGFVGGKCADQWDDDEIEILEDKSTRLPNKIDVYTCHAHPDGHFELSCTAEMVPGDLSRTVLMQQYLVPGPDDDPLEEPLQCRISFNAAGNKMYDVRREEPGGAPLAEPEEPSKKITEFYDDRISSREWFRIGDATYDGEQFH